MQSVVQLMTGCSVWAALEEDTISSAKVSPWEKPVGLLQTGDRRELICMPWRQPVSRALGGTEAAKLAVQTKGAFIPPSCSRQVRCQTRDEQCRLSSPSHAGWAGLVPLARCCHSHRSGGVSGTWLVSHRELLELCQSRMIFVPWLCNV